MSRNEQNWWDFPAAVFLLAAVWFAGIRLDATGWIEHLELVEFLATTGCLLGLLIGKSRLSAFTSKIVAWGYSVVIVPWQLSLAAPLEDRYSERLAEIIGRLSTSFIQFTNNQRLEDPIFFLASISILYWSFSLIAGYMLTRYGRPWYPLISTMVTIIMIEFYDPSGALGWESGAFAISLLLLAGRLHFVKMRRRWQENNLAMDSETGMGLGKGVLILSLALVLFAWNLPVLSPGIWKQVLSSSPGILTPLSWQERLSRLVAALNQSPNGDADNFGGYMGLGRAASAGTDTIFTVSVVESAAPGARYYWRARTYDFYDNGSWVNSQDASLALAAGEQRFGSLERPGRYKAVTSFVISAARIRNLYTAGEPLQLSLPVEVLGQISPAGVEDADAVLALNPLVRGDSYRQTSLVSYPTKQLLRAAGQDYPAWVRARYLQVPAGLTQRTRELAEEITAGLTTPYEKAEAVTAWLRGEIKYEAAVPAPPPGQDVVDWFLFDHKAGYCNYFASAEIMMLRSLGIPTRMAAGYAQGRLDPDSGLYVVLRKDSHAWPEVYFPGVGWVEFEPTTNQPELNYIEALPVGTIPDSQTSNPDDLITGNIEEERMERPIPDGEEPEDEKQNFWETYREIITAALALFVAAGIVFLVHRICRKRKTSFPGLIACFLRRVRCKVPSWLSALEHYFDLPPVSRSFLLVPVYIRLLGGSRPRGATPAETMKLLNEIEPATTYYGQILLAEYEKEAFSEQSPDAEKGLDAAGSLGSQVIKSVWQKTLRW